MWLYVGMWPSRDPHPVSPQTVRLAKGRHRRASRRACVMELSSMLTGEPFSDHPGSVCPVLAAFLRAYNDQLSAPLRQGLYPWASAAAGTHTADRALLAARSYRLTALADGLLPGDGHRRWWNRCLCAHSEAATAGVRAARAVRFRPALQERVDAGLRAIYEIELVDLDAPPTPRPTAAAAPPRLLV